MESLALNILTVGLTSLIAPSAVRLFWKHSLKKVAAVVVIVLNTLAMVVLWTAVRGYLLSGDINDQPRGGNYIMYGVGIAAIVSWGILTTSTDSTDKKDSDGAV